MKLNWMRKLHLPDDALPSVEKKKWNHEEGEEGGVKERGRKREKERSVDQGVYPIFPN